MRRHLCHAAALLGAVLLVFPMPGRAQGPNTVALVGGMLIDGLDTPPLHHAAIVVVDGRIADVGPANQIDIPTDAVVIDTTGRTMLPGLIDLHVHLSILGHGDYKRWFPWLAEHADRISLDRILAISARQLLMSGVTSAIDLGGKLKESLRVRDRINSGEIPGPRLSVSGPWLTRRAGVFPPDYQIEVKSSEQAARAVDELARAGVDVIKAHSGLTREDYSAIVAAAHRHNIRVHAHLYSEQSVRDAFEGGVDVLQHVGSAGEPAYSPELVRAIAASRRPVVPTAAHRVWVYPATVDFPERLQDPQLRKDFPPELYQEVQQSFRNWPGLSYFGTIDRQMFFGDESISQWIDAGAVIGMGTDSGTPMNFHTEALWRELKVFVDHGMPPQRAIAAATRVNARILGNSNELGTIEPGKLADLIVVHGNPLFDIVALSHVQIVMKGGVVYKGGPAKK